MNTIFIPTEWKQVDIWSETNANNLGEALRVWTFVGRNNERGCYETFRLAEFFKEVDKGNYFKKALKEISLTVKDRLNCYIYDQKKITHKFFTVEAMKLIVAWNWDEGDGVLYFRLIKKDYDIEVINTDCKCEYDWEFINQKRK